MVYRFSKKLQRESRNMILEVADRGKSIPGFISFAVGNPAQDSIPVELLQECAAEVFAENPMAILQYGPSSGEPALHDWLHDWLVNQKGLPAGDNRVVLLSGSGKGLGLVPRTLCAEGDEAFCDEFCFPNATNGILNVGAVPVGIPMDDQGMIPEALEEKAKSGKGKFVYLIPNFHNPMGITLPLQRRKDLYEVAAKYDLIIYEDDPYGEIRFAGEEVPSLKSMDTDGRVIYAGSFSKTLSSGLRVGFLYAAEELARKISSIKDADGQEPIFNQRIIARSLAKMDYRQHLQNISQIYGNKCRLMVDGLQKHCSERCKILVPEGGMFVWVEIPKDVDIEAVNEAAIHAGIGVVKSAAFAVDPNRPGHAFRLNFSALPDDKITQGVEIFGRVTRQFC